MQTRSKQSAARRYVLDARADPETRGSYPYPPSSIEVNLGPAPFNYSASQLNRAAAHLHPQQQQQPRQQPQPQQQQQPPPPPRSVTVSSRFHFEEEPSFPPSASPAASSHASVQRPSQRNDVNLAGGGGGAATAVGGEDDGGGWLGGGGDGDGDVGDNGDQGSRTNQGGGDGGSGVPLDEVAVDRQRMKFIPKSELFLFGPVGRNDATLDAALETGTSNAIVRHVKQPVEMIRDDLPEEHQAFITTSKSPIMFSLYMFVRKLASMEPHNPAQRTEVRNSNIEQMHRLWNFQTQSIMFEWSRKLIQEYEKFNAQLSEVRGIAENADENASVAGVPKPPDDIDPENVEQGTELIPVGADGAPGTGRTLPEKWLARQLPAILDYFLAGGTAMAIRNVWEVLQRYPDCEVGRYQLADVFRYRTISDLFAYVVHYRMSKAATAAGNRGMATEVYKTMLIEHNAYLARIRRAKFDTSTNRWTIAATVAASTASSASS